MIIEKEAPSEGFPDGREVETVIEPNTNEKAVVRILVPTKKVPISEVREEQSPRRSPEGERAASSLEKEKPKEAEGEEKKEEDKPAEEKEEEMVDIEED